MAPKGKAGEVTEIALVVKNQTPQFIPHGAAADVPQIRILFRQLTKDGKMEPYRMQGTELVGVDLHWASGYEINGAGLIVAVGPEIVNPGRQLQWGKKYTTRNLPINPEFSVPVVEKGKVVDIVLVVKDEKKAEEDARLAAEAAAKAKAELKDLHVTVKGIPAEELKQKPSLWMVLYMLDQSETGGRIQDDGTFEIKEVKKLGGELIVAKRSATPGLPPEIRAYIATVNKTEISIPEDATYYLQPEKAIDVTVRYDPKAGENAPTVKDAPKLLVGIYVNETTRVPVGFFRIAEPETGEIKVQIMPGDYWMRLNDIHGKALAQKKVHIEAKMEPIWITDKPAGQ